MLLQPTFLLTVLLVFIRVGGVLVAAPVFRQPFIPTLVKVLLGVVLAYSLAGLVQAPLPPMVTQGYAGFIVAAIVEALTGLLLGFAGQFLFSAVQFAGDLIGMQVGLSLSQAYNPLVGEAGNPMGQLLSLGFLLLFILLDGIQGVVSALALSFQVVPLGGANLAAGGPLLLTWTGAFFVTALRLAAPFIVTMLLLDVALGILVRMLPSLDLFGLGISLKLGVGMILFVLIAIELFPMGSALTTGVLDAMQGILEVLAPAAPNAAPVP